jgi:hypothetical protein
MINPHVVDGTQAFRSTVPRFSPLRGLPL